MARIASKELLAPIDIYFKKCIGEKLHTLIVGQSFSGKSNLAKNFAHKLAAQGHEIVVFDPMQSTGWPEGSKLYSKPASFVEAFWKHKNCYVFIDEARVLFEAEKNEAERMAFQGRHGGRLLFFIGQRAMSMIPPNARDQCGKVFAFKQSKKDSDTLTEEKSEIFSLCRTLKKGEFVASDGYSDFIGSLDYSEGLPPKVNMEANI